MKKYAAFLLACTTFTAAGPLSADVYIEPDAEAPFFWTDLDTPPADSRVPEKPPATPVLDGYPLQDAPKNSVPDAGLPRYLDDNRCCTPENAPDPRIHAPTGGTASSDTVARPSTYGPCGAHGAGPDPRSFGGAPGYYGDGGPVPAQARDRRGEMTGDDGVLEAIQDNPCAALYRRGGASAESVAGYSHPEDIRRANTLEERSIPTHDIGRYAPEGSGIWHRDPDNPFLDASRTWTVERGTMLSHLLMDWGEMAGFDVVWRTAHDYVLQADVHIRGTFPEAAGQVIESFSNANPPLVADFYLANKVLVVQSANEFDGR